MHHEDDLDAWQIAAIREGMADFVAGGCCIQGMRFLGGGWRFQSPLSKGAGMTGLHLSAIVQPVKVCNFFNRQVRYE